MKDELFKKLQESWSTIQKMKEKILSPEEMKADVQDFLLALKRAGVEGYERSVSRNGQEFIVKTLGDATFAVDPRGPILYIINDGMLIDKRTVKNPQELVNAVKQKETQFTPQMVAESRDLSKRYEILEESLVGHLKTGVSSAIRNWKDERSREKAIKLAKKVISKVAKALGGGERKLKASSDKMKSILSQRQATINKLSGDLQKATTDTNKDIIQPVVQELENYSTQIEQIKSEIDRTLESGDVVQGETPIPPETTPEPGQIEPEAAPEAQPEAQPEVSQPDLDFKQVRDAKLQTVMDLMSRPNTQVKSKTGNPINPQRNRPAAQSAAINIIKDIVAAYNSTKDYQATLKAFADKYFRSEPKRINATAPYVKAVLGDTLKESVQRKRFKDMF